MCFDVWGVYLKNFGEFFEITIVKVVKKLVEEKLGKKLASQVDSRLFYKFTNIYRISFLCINSVVIFLH